MSKNGLVPTVDRRRALMDHSDMGTEHMQSFIEAKQLIFSGPNPLRGLIAFIQQLDEAKLWYRLDSIRDAILVEVSTPGTQWEVEFFEDGRVEVERFRSDGRIEDEKALSALFDERDV